MKFFHPFFSKKTVNSSDRMNLSMLWTIQINISVSKKSTENENFNREINFLVRGRSAIFFRGVSSFEWCKISINRIIH